MQYKYTHARTKTHTCTETMGGTWSPPHPGPRFPEDPKTSIVGRYLTRVCRPCHFDTKADRCDLRSTTRIAPPLMLQGTALPRRIYTLYRQRTRNSEAVTGAHPVRVLEITRKCKLGFIHKLRLTGCNCCCRKSGGLGESSSDLASNCTS